MGVLPFLQHADARYRISSAPVEHHRYLRQLSCQFVKAGYSKTRPLLYPFLPALALGPKLRQRFRSIRATVSCIFWAISDGILRSRIPLSI